MKWRNGSLSSWLSNAAEGQDTKLITQATSRDPEALSHRQHFATSELGDCQAPLDLPPGLDAPVTSPQQHAAVICGIDAHTPQRAPFTFLVDAATSQEWSVVDTFFGANDSVHPSARPGLCAALERLSSGTAAMLVLDERAYRSMPDCLWLKVAVQNIGGVLLPVATGRRASRSDAAGERVAGTEIADRFLEAFVRPLGLCPEDVG